MRFVMDAVGIAESRQRLRRFRMSQWGLRVAACALGAGAASLSDYSGCCRHSAIQCNAHS
jgi:hypothetical protein